MYTHAWAAATCTRSRTSTGVTPVRAHASAHKRLRRQSPASRSFALDLPASRASGDMVLPDPAVVAASLHHAGCRPHQLRLRPGHHPRPAPAVAPRLLLRRHTSGCPKRAPGRQTTGSRSTCACNGQAPSNGSHTASSFRGAPAVTMRPPRPSPASGLHGLLRLTPATASSASTPATPAAPCAPSAGCRLAPRRRPRPLPIVERER
jgi:hypothetical protein